MDLYDFTGRYHCATFEADCDLNALSVNWQREAAALWRLEADINNGAYLQFICNWGDDSYYYGEKALRNMGANKMAALVRRCQDIVIKYGGLREHSQLREAMSDEDYEELMKLSHDFMDYPDDIDTLGVQYFSQFTSEV